MVAYRKLGGFKRGLDGDFRDLDRGLPLAVIEGLRSDEDHGSSSSLCSTPTGHSSSHRKQQQYI